MTLAAAYGAWAESMQEDLRQLETAMDGRSKQRRDLMRWSVLTLLPR